MRDCRACRAGRPWACPDSPSFRHALPDGERGAASGRRAGGRRGRPGEAVLSYCGIATMSEATVVPEAAAIPIPDGVDPAVAALIGCCVSTGVGAALKTAAVEAGSTVAVIGLGGVGLSCVMGAALAGASRIVAVDRVAAKLATALEVGATDGLLAGDDAAETLAALRDLTDGGPDYAFEAIGLPVDGRARDRVAAAGRHRGPGRDDPARGPGLVRRLPVRRREPADPGLELRVRRPGGGLPAVRPVAPRRPAADRRASSTGASGSTTSRMPSTRCAAASTRARSSRSTERARLAGLAAGAAELRQIAIR